MKHKSGKMNRTEQRVKAPTGKLLREEYRKVVNRTPLKGKKKPC